MSRIYPHWSKNKHGLSFMFTHTTNVVQQERALHSEITILHSSSFSGNDCRRKAMYNKITLLAILAVVLDIISCSIPYWARNNVSNSGLWMFCIVTGKHSSCSYFHTDKLNDWQKGVQATVTLGLVLAAIGTALLTIIVWEKERIQYAAYCISRTSVILFFLAGTFTLIGVVIYGVKTDSPKDLYVGFALAVVAAFLYPVVGFYILIKKSGYLTL